MGTVNSHANLHTILSGNISQTVSDHENMAHAHPIIIKFFFDDVIGLFIGNVNRTFACLCYCFGNRYFMSIWTKFELFDFGNLSTLIVVGSNLYIASRSAYFDIRRCTILTNKQIYLLKKVPLLKLCKILIYSLI